MTSCHYCMKTTRDGSVKRKSFQSPTWVFGQQLYARIRTQYYVPATFDAKASYQRNSVVVIHAVSAAVDLQSGQTFVCCPTTATEVSQVT